MITNQATPPLSIIKDILCGSFLANQSAGFLTGEPGSLLSAGMIPLITIGVGLKVASTFVTLFNRIIEEKN